MGSSDEECLMYEHVSPLRSAPPEVDEAGPSRPRTGGEAGPSGRTLEDTGPSLDDPNSPEMIDAGLYANPISITPERSWIQKCHDLSLERTAAVHYHCGPGYRFKIPTERDTVCVPPSGYTAVFLKDLEFGLRFPLDPDVETILVAMNVAICQLHPLAVRNIIAFVWTCRYLGYLPSVNLFRALQHLKCGWKKETEGYWSSVSEKNRIIAYPRLSSVHSWKDKFLYVSVPSEWCLPKHFRIDVHTRLEPIDKFSPLAAAPLSSVVLNAEEKKALMTFTCEEGGSRHPARWLPPAEVIFNDEYLCRMGLIPNLSRDHFGAGFSNQQLQDIGIGDNGLPFTNVPENPQHLRKKSLMDAAKEFGKSVSGRKIRLKTPKRAEVVVDVEDDAVHEIAPPIIQKTGPSAAATAPKPAAGQEPQVAPAASRAAGKEPQVAPAAPKAKRPQVAPAGSKEPAEKKRRTEGMSSEDMMAQPLSTPGDDLQDVSMQPDQSLEHILSKDKSKSAGSSEAAIHSSVQSKAAEKNKELVAEKPSDVADVGANLQSRHQMVVRTVTQLSKQLQRAGSMIRAYEEELKGQTVSSTIDELQKKLKVLAEQVTRLEKTNVYLFEKNGRYVTGLNEARQHLADQVKKVSALEAELREKKKDLADSEARSGKRDRILAAAEARVTEKSKALADSEARVAERNKALAAAEARVSERDAALAASEAKFKQAAAALAEVTAKFAVEREQKAKEFEDFKTAMVDVLKDKFEEGFQTCDAETKEVIQLMDPNFDWENFEKVLAARDEEAEKAGPSGQAQTK